MSGCSQKGVIGVVGGMGPLAGVRLVELITRLTPAVADQDHRDVVLVSLPGRISDRTEFLLGRTTVNPAPAVADCVKVLTRAGATHVGMACNTVHAPPIWSAIEASVRAEGSPVQLLHLIDETVADVASRVPRGAKVGVLGTTGTIRSDLYGRVLRAAGFEVLYLEDNRQNALHAAIYNEENGIKAAAQVSEAIRAFVAEVASELIDAGAACVVLGCTELPLALSQPSLRDVPLIDPSVALARKLIAATVS